jgi:hypothetical protein
MVRFTFLPALFAASASFAATPWLVLSDIHLDETGTCALGRDTSPSLFESALAQMRAVSPDPPVVLIPGDLVAHHISGLGCHNATDVLVSLAQRFGQVFPRAQFALALGNNDSDCADYGSPGEDFFQRVTAAWEPLVNRQGSAPDFSKRFPESGGYQARLPNGIRLLVVDDVPWGRKKGPQCGAHPLGPADPSIASWRATAPASKHWAMAHIPPGISVHESHRGQPTPLLSTNGQEQLQHLLQGGRVDLLLAAHIHRFALRVAGDTPILIAPALSPIYENAPSFLALDVDEDGSVASVNEYAYDGKAWSRQGGTEALGIARPLDAAQVSSLESRLGNDAGLRATFWKLFWGKDTPLDSGELDGTRCAMSHFDAASYEACLPVR